MRLYAHVLNENVAPGFTNLTNVVIPDLRGNFPQAQHWLANHFLNSILRARFHTGLRQQVISLLRRITTSFEAYHDAKERTEEFVEQQNGGEQPIRLYYKAVDAWEDFVLHTGMALDLFRYMNGRQGAFEKDDGSPEQRLYTMANQIKHLGSCVASGQCTEQDTLPLWLSNDGLESFGTSISYAEAAGVLEDVSKLADLLQDPAALSEQHQNQQ